MGNTSATALSPVRLPAARALVPLERVPGRPAAPRVEEVAATAKVIRYDEVPARLRPRGERQATGRDGRDSRAAERPVAFAGPAREAGGTSYGGASAQFVAQVLGQVSAVQTHQFPLHHRDAPVLGSEAYRRAGGEPALYGNGPALIRIAV